MPGGELTLEEKLELLRLLEARERLKAEQPLAYHYPDSGKRGRQNYPKHIDFFSAGAKYRERCMMAGNRTGKTFAGAYETACHLTGLYPDWWPGRRFAEPVDVWVAGKSNESTRDIIQEKLLGSKSADAGMIPIHCRGGITYRRGVPNAVDTMLVRHVSGYWSVLQFKSYQQGRDAFEGTAKHVVWLDEEPPEDIYDECLIRTATTSGLVYLTFTPLEGVTGTVKRFLTDGIPLPGEVTPTRYLTTVEWAEAPHLSEKDKAELLAATPEHMRDARTRGIPVLGSGAVFAPIREEDILVDPFPIPDYWPMIGGMDFGWDHPFAAVILAWDRDNDVIHVVQDYRARHTTPLHARLALDQGWHIEWLPWAWPHDGLQHEKSAGVPLAEEYRRHGFKMLPEFAKFPDGSTSVEAGISEMIDRMQTGRWKVHKTCALWREEFRLYHRKDGKIVKAGDDTISASRYAMMMIKNAVQRPKKKQPRPKTYNWRTV